MKINQKTKQQTRFLNMLTILFTSFWQRDSPSAILQRDTIIYMFLFIQLQQVYVEELHLRTFCCVSRRCTLYFVI